MASPTRNLGRHGRNISWLFVADLVGKVLGLFFFAYLFKKLTVTENEWYALYLMVMPILSVVNTAGFHDVLNREMSKDRDRVHRLLSSAVAVQTLLFIVIAPAVWFAAGALGYAPVLRRILALTAAVAFIWALINMHMAVFAAHEKFKYTSLITIATRIATVVGGIALLFFGCGVFSLIVYLLLVYIAQLVACYATVQARCGGYRFDWSPAEAGYLLREGVPMALGRFAATSYYRIDLPMLRSIAGPRASEEYAVGPRFFALLTSVPDIFEAVFFPILSRRATETAEAQRFAFERYFKAMAMLALPMGVGMTVLGAEIVRTLGRAEYVSGTPVVAVLTWLIALAMLDRCSVVYLRATARQRWLVYAYGAALVVKTAACFCVIPRFGIPGLLMLNAAVSLVLTATLLAMARAALPILDMSRLAGLVVRPLAACIAMAAALWFIRDRAIFWTIPLGACVYALVLLFTRAFDAFDKELLASLVRRKRS